MNKLFLKFSIKTALMAVAALLVCATAFAGQLKVNLVLDGDRVMVYAGSDEGVKIGDTFTITRGGEAIATIEAVKVESTYFIAKVTSKAQDIRDMDNIEAGAAAVKSKPAAKDEKKDEKAADKKDDKKDTKKDDKAADKKTAEKKDTKKDDKKAADKKTAEKKDTKKDDTAKEEKADKKEDKKKDEKAAAAKPAEPKGPLTSTRYSSMGGPSGLFMMPTAELAPKKHGSLSYFTTRRSRSSSGTMTLDPTDIDFLAYSTSLKFSLTMYSVVYGIDDKLEFSLATGRRKLDLSVYGEDAISIIDADLSTSAKRTEIGVKYNPHKRYMLQPTTHKKFQYALGINRVTISGFSSNFTRFYGVASLPSKKGTLHGGLYYIDAVSGKIGGQHWGSMVGAEAPLGNRLSMLVEGDIFHGDEIWNAGFRYFATDQYAATIGMYDMTGDPGLLLNVGLNF